MLTSARNYRLVRKPLQYALICDDPSLTKKADHEPSDINKIVERFLKTGTLPVLSLPPVAQDFGDYVFDFQSAQNMLTIARNAFMELPAKVRSRFGNDPHEFVNFVSAREADGRLTNVDELRKMGFALPEVKREVGEGGNAGVVAGDGAA